MTVKIRIEDVSKIFGRTPRKRPLEMLRQGVGKADILEQTGHVVGLAEVNLDLEDGEIFVVMGLSGSGKSTLIRCVNRLIEPTTGHVYIDGEDIIALDRPRLQEVRRTKMAMVFQHFALFPHRSVLANAAYGLKMQGVDADERDQRARDALELVGLGEWAHSPPSALSGGMQQRVGLARALATDPDILLMDEAFSALDPLIRRQMQNELLQLQDRVQKTVLFITHDLNEALRVGNRVAIMRGGRVVQVGTPEEIVTTPADQYVADFIQDVDQGRVLNVDFVMNEAKVVVLGQASLGDAERRIRGMDASAVYVVDDDRRPVGLVTDHDIVEARRRGEDDLSAIMRDEYPRTTSSDTIAEIYEMCAAGLPVAVLDGDGRLEGVVDPLDVLAKLGAIEVATDMGQADAEQLAADAGESRGGQSTQPDEEVTA